MPRARTEHGSRRLVEIRAGSRVTRRRAGRTTASAGAVRRFPALQGVDLDPLPVLSGMRITLVGAGAVGLAAVRMLAPLGLRELTIADPDRYCPENALTTTIDPAAIGEWKALAAGRLAKSISPATRVRALVGLAEELPLAVLARSDYLFGCVDNLVAERFLSSRATQLGIPLLCAAVAAEQLSAQVRTQVDVQSGGACLLCGYSAREWEALEAATVFSCTGVASDAHAQSGVLAPTPSIAALCSQAASLLVMQFLRLALRVESPARASVIELSGLAPNLLVSTQMRSPTCRGEHAAWTSVELRSPPEQATARELLALAGAETADARLTVPGHEFVRRTSCHCTAHGELGRFLPIGAAGDVCSRCGRRWVAHPLYTHRAVSARALGSLADARLADLGAPDVGAILVTSPERTWLVLGPDVDRDGGRECA